MYAGSVLNTQLDYDMADEDIIITYIYIYIYIVERERGDMQYPRGDGFLCVFINRNRILMIYHADIRGSHVHLFQITRDRARSSN